GAAMDQRYLRAQAGRHAGSAVRADRLRGGGMMISGDRVIWRSGDRKSNPTAETLRRGGEQWPNLTTETRRHGGKSGDRGIGKPGNRDFGKSGHLEIGTSGHRKSSDHPITRDHPTRPDLPRTTRLRNAWNVLQAVVQEIFDESAYRRF